MCVLAMDTHMSTPPTPPQHLHFNLPSTCLLVVLRSSHTHTHFTFTTTGHQSQHPPSFREVQQEHYQAWQCPRRHCSGTYIYTYTHAHVYTQIYCHCGALSITRYKIHIPRTTESNITYYTPTQSKQKREDQAPVSPILLGLLLFVVVGSAIFQIIQTAKSGPVF